MYEMYRVYPKAPPVRRLSAAPNLQGLGFSVTGSLDVSALASQLTQQILGAVWPPVEEKINQVVPVVANMAIDVAKARLPELIDTAKPKLAEVIDTVVKPKIPGLVDAAKPKIPELLNIALPIAEKRINTLAAAYEKKYMGIVLTITKYAKPIAMGAAVVGVLVAAASIKTLISK
ncbi:MAG: hypothetical protein WC683_02195 [bacterium]